MLVGVIAVAGVSLGVTLLVEGIDDLGEKKCFRRNEHIDLAW